MPGEHAVHVLAPEAEYVPGWQRLQLSFSVVSTLYFPAEQKTLHLIAPTPEVSPAAQLVQALAPPAEIVLTGQKVHTVAPVDAEYDPEAQAAQGTLVPGEYMPFAQLLQLEAPVTTVNVPARQLVHPLDVPVATWY